MSIHPTSDHPTPAQWAFVVAVRGVLARLDARPVPPGGVIGRRKGHDTFTVRIGE